MDNSTLHSQHSSLTVTYTPLQGGDGESRWLRVEQVETGNAHLTVADAAELIDSLFDLEPCDDGMGGGGEEADEENDPDEGKFDSKMAELLRKASLCAGNGNWTTEVDVYRSHRDPQTYELRGERVTVAATRPMRESKRQIVEASGAVIELEWPYAGGLSGIPAGVKWEVRGSTVNLDRPVNGRLTLRYDAWWERVTLGIAYVGVAEDKKIDDMILALAVSGGASDKALGANKPTAAAVAAFWGNLAASCELEPPEEDPSSHDVNVDEVCGDDDDSGDHDWEDASGCWETVRHFDRCNCSGKEINEWEEQVAAPCNGAGAGSHVGSRDVFGEYLRCPEEDDEQLQDPEYYKKRCCKYPDKPLPRCREKYRKFMGGVAIENGAAYWRNIYGADVVLIAVMPESGECGAIIERWNVPQKNCCDGVEPLEPDPNNPKNIEPGGLYEIDVQGGATWEKTWRAQGGIHFEQNGGHELKTASKGVYIRAEENVCPNPTVSVDDGCSQLTMTFDGPDSEGPALPDDMTVGKNQSFFVDASGGVRPYMWMAGGGLILEGYSQDGSRAYLRTPNNDDWCVGEVTVVDVCGRSADMSVYNAQTGRWVEQRSGSFSPCDPSGKGITFVTAERPEIQDGMSKPRQGYRVYWISVVNNRNRVLECARGSAWPECLEMGHMVVEGTDYMRNFNNRCVSSGVKARDFDAGSKCCIERDTRYSDCNMCQAKTYANYATRLWKYVCADA